MYFFYVRTMESWHCKRPDKWYNIVFFSVLSTTAHLFQAQ